MIMFSAKYVQMQQHAVNVIKVSIFHQEIAIVQITVQFKDNMVLAIQMDLVYANVCF